jgi:hypothetical protein
VVLFKLKKEKGDLSNNPKEQLKGLKYIYK